MKFQDMPDRIAKLPRDDRGYPVPWFVQWIDDKPQFPIMDAEKYILAIQNKRCWVCGEAMGSFKTFVVGPMCGISRTSGEPPSHRECALFSVRHCPFLVNPKMKRIENEFTKESGPMAGVMIPRNPGVTLLWVCRDYKIFRDPNNKPLIEMGHPLEIEAWANGQRTFDMSKIEESIRTGLPSLEAMCRDDRDRSDLKRFATELRNLLIHHLKETS